MVHHQRNARFFRRFQQAVSQLRGQIGQGFVNARLRDFGQTGKTGGHGDRVTGQRTGLVNRTGRCQGFHHIFASTKCAHRHTAADDFAKAGQVRHHIVIRLRARQRDAETGHHFVDN
ncbi:hypothetical protein D3C80_1547020 [compost metagenome]